MLIDYDKTIELSYPIQFTIHIQNTFEDGLTEFAFKFCNANRFAFNAHYFHRIDRP